MQGEKEILTGIYNGTYKGIHADILTDLVDDIEHTSQCGRKALEAFKEAIATQKPAEEIHRRKRNFERMVYLLEALTTQHRVIRRLAKKQVIEAENADD